MHSENRQAGNGQDAAFLLLKGVLGVSPKEANALVRPNVLQVRILQSALRSRQDRLSQWSRRGSARAPGRKELKIEF